ncbi:MAG: ABC transporter permease [Clostridiales bacterium]|jgi:ABC-2 type transport system permease protein|nr:ABC transporter permease [Clostridiales bacterium]
MTAIIKKELRGYFNSWIGYVFLFIFVGLVGVFFSLINLQNQYPGFQDSMSNITIFYLVLIPVLTMRLFAEEARQKTDQLLFTSPVTVMSIVVGKFLSALCLSVIGMAITVLFPIIISRYGTLPYAQIITSYLGYILLTACFISVGMFISVLTDNQIIAAVVTFFTMILFLILDAIASALTSGPAATAMGSMVFLSVIIAMIAFFVYDSTKNYYVAGISALVLIGVATATYLIDATLYDGLIGKVIRWLSIMSRFTNFSSGIINVSDIVYYITFAIVFVYFTINVIEKRRWR